MGRARLQRGVLIPMCVLGGGGAPAPAAPTELSATPVSTSQVNLAWTDNATDETAYRVYRSTDGVAYAQVGDDLAADANSYSDTTISANQTYYYKVAAVGAGGEAFSNMAGAGAFFQQPDGAAGQDAVIESGASATKNFGALDIIPIGELNAGPYQDRSLIKFDLTALPAGATIVSATLSLFALTDFATNARAFRVFRLKRAWVEGTRTGAADSPATGATWNRYDTTNNWQTAGGFGENDCEQTDIGSRNFTASETINEFKDFVLTPTTKAALDLGNGWLIKADTESDDGYSFASSDHATASSRPKITILYTTSTVF